MAFSGVAVYLAVFAYQYISAGNAIARQRQLEDQTRSVLQEWREFRKPRAKGSFEGRPASRLVRR
jgi:hypothetical protein